MNRHHLFCAIILSLTTFALTGCQTTTPPPQISMLPSSGFLKEWEAPLKLRRDPVKGLYLRGNVLVVYASSNHGYFIDATSGSILGFDEITSKGYDLQPPVETTSFIAIPTTSSIELFDKAGHRANRFATPFAIQSPATSIGDTIFLGLSHGKDSRLGRFDLSTTQLRTGWELYTTDVLHSAPAALNDGVYAAGTDGKVWAVTANRFALWNTPGNIFRTDGGITADLAIDDAALYVPSQDKKLYALDRSTGKIIWSYYAGLPLVEAPVVIGNSVYQLVPGRGLTALDKVDGKFAREPVWIQPDAEQVLAADEKYLYVRSQNSIVALDRASGTPAFKSGRTDLTSFATNTTSPLIYASTTDGSILAIRPVIKPGAVGEVVFDTMTLQESVAMAN